MADTFCSSNSIRELELRLLRCSLSPSSTNDGDARSSDPFPIINHKTSLHHLQLAEEVVSLIEKGDYVGAVASSGARLVFEFVNLWDNFQDSTECADRFYLEVQNKVDFFLTQGDDDDDGGESNPSCRAFLLMSIAVAAFLAFTQNNMTGPCQTLPSFPFPFLSPPKDDGISSVGVEWDTWSRNQFMFTGSDLHGTFSLLQYIIYAKMLLVKIKDFLMDERLASFVGIRTISWWLARLILLQQRILDESTSSLFDSLQVLKAETVNYFGQAEHIKNYWGTLLHEGEALTIVSMAHLEAGIIEYTYGRVDHSSKHFDIAEEASGLQLSVTGILGFRTLHQVEPRAQRVLVANTTTPCIGGLSPGISLKAQQHASELREDNLGSRSHEIIEASDILMAPRLLNNEKEPRLGANGTQNGGTSISLSAIQQAVTLARSLIVEKNTRDEMQSWNMAPFIEAVDAQEISYFTIRCLCDILRVRWESTRSHTKERALLMMEKMVQNAYESSPGASHRIPYCFGLCVPSIPALRKELGELYVRCGLIGEALKIFEDLELWDNLIYCYRLLEKKAAAVELIKARLCKMPNDPSLWCALGGVTNIDTYYEKALEVSNNKSARAKRSLARSAYNKGDYERSKILWESALAMNSMYPDGWFAFGAAALKARDIDKALDGFSHAVQLDPDSGEAWNNLACLHMVKRKYKESFIAFKEALKFRRGSWQLWESYSQVALNIGNYRQALEGTMMVLNITNNKKVDADLLERIMIEMESRISKHNLSPAARGDPVQNHIHDSFGDSFDEPKDEDQNLVLSKETKHLVELLGKVLQQSIRGGIGEDVWGLYARWHKMKGDLTMCCEALLKQVRSYQGANLWNNRDRFKKFANASLQLCEVYMDISRSTGSLRELNAAEMHLRNTVKQAVSFSELEEFRALQSCLEEVRKRLHAVSVPSAGNP